MNQVRQLGLLDPNQRYTVEEAAAFLRQSRAKTFNDIRDGKLEAFTDGRRRYISGRVIAAASSGAEAV